MKDTINFFIVGYPRSGTTLTASLLSNHSSIFVPAETHYFRKFIPLDRSSTPDEFYRAFINDARLRDLEIPGTELKRIIKDKFPNKAGILISALHFLAQKNNKHIVGEKTPAHILNHKEIITACPNTKFIYVMRDGRDCVLSNIKEKWTFSNPKKHAAEWNYFIRSYKKLAYTYPDRVILIKFEDLIDDTEQTLKTIMAFIGIDYEVEQTTTHQDTSVIPIWEKKWKAKASTPPDKNNKYKWKDCKDKKLITILTVIMERHLKEFGYEYKLDTEYKYCIKNAHVVRNLIYTQNIYPLAKAAATLNIYKLLKTIFHRPNS